MIYLLWAFYLLGGLGVLLKRAYKSAKDQNTPWQSVPQYCKVHAPEILTNFVISTALFWSVWRDTSFLTKMLLMVGVTKDVQVPLNPLTAALYGVFSDQVVDLIVGQVLSIFGKVKAILPGGGNTGDASDPKQP